jgi:hypothetical protein
VSKIVMRRVTIFLLRLRTEAYRWCDSVGVCA